MTRPLAYIDVETTGLDPARHTIWEWAIILGDTIGHSRQIKLTEREIGYADPEALEAGGWFDGYRTPTEPDCWPEAASDIACLLDGATLVGAQTHFDAAFLAALLRRIGAEPPWHNRLLDVESMAAGVMGWSAPRSLSNTAGALGLDLGQYARHTALGDAWLARDVHRAVQARSAQAVAR